MKNQINKVKRFLRNLPHIELDMTGDEDILDCYDFTSPNKPYYVYLDVESRGCFEMETGFKTKTEVNEIVRSQCNSENKWDHVVIFSISKNKIIEPHV